MRFFLTIILIGIVIAGCSSAPASNQQESTNNSTSGNIDIARIAPEGKVTEDVATNEANSSSPTIVMTVNSPAIQLTSIQGNTSTSSTPVPISTENWQMYTNNSLGITVDYPTDWSISEQDDGAIFSSPTNSTIQLKVTNANSSGNEIRIINQRCTSQTNAYNLTADICVENSPFSYTAKFAVKSPDGSAQWLTLTTTARDTAIFFHAMFNSVRPEK